MTARADPTAGLLDPGVHAEGDPHAIWRWMREHAPVHWQPPTDLPGFWSLTRYEDVRAVYQDPTTFSSAYGVLLRPSRHGDDPGGGLTLALSDPPRHKQLRSLVAAWFHTRGVRALEDHIRAVTRTVLARAMEVGTCDFVHDIAGRLSLSVISRIIGIPEEDDERVYEWTNQAFEAHTSLAAQHQFVKYLMELMFRRMEEPAGDLLSSLVMGTADGGLLSEEEILLNCENLIGATENGRLALIGGMRALLDHPNEWRALREERSLLPSAVEEILRWTSSATHSLRTAVRPHAIRGQRIEAGDRVVLWLPSANRDEDVFPQPYRFDIARTPNRHLALAAGEHYCIGSTLARTELRVLFSEILDAACDIEPNGPVTPLRSLAVNGPASLPIRITPRRRSTPGLNPPRSRVE